MKAKPEDVFLSSHHTINMQVLLLDENVPLKPLLY